PRPRTRDTAPSPADPSPSPAAPPPLDTVLASETVAGAGRLERGLARLRGAGRNERGRLGAGEPGAARVTGGPGVRIYQPPSDVGKVVSPPPPKGVMIQRRPWLPAANSLTPRPSFL